ncbi:MAG: hypothetical protein ABUS79_13810 [Pseudomonadota bacterium]
MNGAVFIAMLAASAGASLACGRSAARPQPPGDPGAGGNVPDKCRSHDIDIPSATLAGAVTINGVSASPDPNARFLLRNGVNDLVEIPFAGASYSVRVAPGTYEVFFSATGPTALAPVNQLARLHTGVIIGPDDTTTLDVDVPAATIAGAITINGAALAPADAVTLSLRNAAGDTVTIASNSGGAYAARVVPGTFDLFLTSPVAGPDSALPMNQLARISRDVVITAGTSTLDVDVPSVTVLGTVAIGGVPAGPSNRGWVYLRNAADGDVVRIAVANSATYRARVVPGSYDLYFTGTTDAYSVTNQNARLRTGVVVASTGTTVLDVDVPSATLTGTLSLDGAAPVATDSAHLVLRNATGDYAQIPWDSDGTYSVNVVPGTYDLFYSKDNTVQAATPSNQLARLRAGVVVAAAGTTVVDIDVTSTTVMGMVKINGAPADAGNAGIVTLRSAEGDRAVIANTARSTFLARVVPGTYDLYYTRTATPANTATEAPANHAAKLQSGLVLAPGATTVFDIDIPSATVSGAITINGTSAGTGDHGALTLQSAAGDFAPFASTNGGVYTARLIPGMYHLFYSHAGRVGDTTPMNTLFKLHCFTVD